VLYIIYTRCKIYIWCVASYTIYSVCTS